MAKLWLSARPISIRRRKLARGHSRMRSLAKGAMMIDALMPDRVLPDQDKASAIARRRGSPAAPYFRVDVVRPRLRRGAPEPPGTVPLPTAKADGRSSPRGRSPAWADRNASWFRVRERE